jgi:hypothetical protein
MYKQMTIAVNDSMFSADIRESMILVTEEDVTPE